ncbi:MAG TPA: hypothetical protein PLY19_00335 [Rhodoglobus sp.]|nr:hypothetical protein [Rhodoglobus sp.]
MAREDAFRRRNLAGRADIVTGDTERDQLAEGTLRLVQHGPYSE